MVISGNSLGGGPTEPNCRRIFTDKLSGTNADRPAASARLNPPAVASGVG